MAVRKLTSGTKTLLLGEPGTGKTSSLATFVSEGLKAGIDPHLFVLITDPDGENALLSAWDRLSLPPERLHTKFIPVASEGFDALLKRATAVRDIDHDQLSKMKVMDKSSYGQYVEFLSALKDFVPDHEDGKSYGNVGDFPPNYMLAIDSMSGVNYMALKLVIGGKVQAHQGEWGNAMNMEEDLLMKLTGSLSCFVTVTCHVDKDIDEIGGGLSFYPAFLGRKLAPKVPRIFSDVVLTARDDKGFFWATQRANYGSLKFRTLPDSPRLLPSFAPMIGAVEFGSAASGPAVTEQDTPSA